MKYSKIKSNDIANGLGVTVSLWTQGCPHHCKGCFNKETWDFSKGKIFTEEDKKYILELLDKNNVKRDLSILGGEPLCEQNLEGVKDLCKYIKAVRPATQIYIWTGYEIESFTKSQKEILEHIDFLIDGKFIEAQKDITLKLRGSKNQRVIDIKKTLKNKKITEKVF